MPNVKILCDWELIRKLDSTALILGIYHKSVPKEINLICDKALELNNTLKSLRKETLTTTELFFEILSEYYIDKDYVHSENFKKILAFYEEQSELLKNNEVNN